MGYGDNMVQAESIKMVSMSNFTHSEQKLGGLAMDNNNIVHPTPKYKRRRVSAVRDFPAGCGPFTPSVIVSTTNEEPVSGGIGDKKFGPCGAEFLPDTSVPSQLNHVEVNPVVSADHANGVELAVPIARSKVDAVNAAVEERVLRKYPPRRRISAVRDFPAFCGTNAPRLVKEENESHNPAAVNRSLGQETSDIEENPVAIKQLIKTQIMQVVDTVLDADAFKSRVERNVSKPTVDEVQAECLGPASNEIRNEDEFGTPYENKIMVVVPVDIESGGINSPGESLQNWSDEIFDVVPKSGNSDIGGLEEDLGMDMVVCMEQTNSKRELLDLSDNKNLLSSEDFEILETASGGSIVQGLMAAENCPWRQVRGLSKPRNSSVGTKKRKSHDVLSFAQRESAFRIKKAKVEKGKSVQKNSSSARKAGQDMSEMVECDKQNALQHGGQYHDLQLVRRSHDFGVSLPPSRPNSLSGKSANSDGSRNQVREALRLFQAVCRKLLQEEEASLKEEVHGPRRIDLQAAKILKEKGRYVNVGKQILGSVPGVEVGDEFNYRVELNIVGLHRPLQGGIDYLKQGGKILATSIVSSGGYDDDTDNSDVLIYTGAGGNMISGGKKPEDQKLERGNLALKNSLDAKNPVRVIRGDTKVSDLVDAKGKTYIYDGLYLVEKYWQEIGSHGKLVFKFKLVRIPGQPELAWKVVKSSKKLNVRERLCIDDISQGKEKIPICAVNTIDDEKPPPFKYVTHMMYPSWCQPTTSKGCDCTNGCCDSRKCSCMAKNSGEIPFNHNGAIVEAKPLVYECGPSCKCPSSCYNRVSQHGIRFQLEIFKTEKRGWGVRSLNSIPSGSFICEYAGELLEEKEAEQRTGNDEYLFDIGSNYNDSSLWDGLSTLMPESHSSSHEVLGSGSFTIDAAEYGNVGRFINHSCSPNLYAQNVLYDHEDSRIPHIMFFAAENIPPLQELTYHYNYMIDQVFDSDGNIKKKSCYCGSSECTGRMY